MSEKKLTRQEHLILRAGFIDALWCIQHRQPPPPRMQHRMKEAFLIAKLPEDKPLEFFYEDEMPRLILPIGPTARMPTV
jgi:hypothetical protein